MIDDVSLKILKILQEKARIPNVEVARKMNMAPSAVLERIRKLERQGIIDGYEVRLNPELFNRRVIAFVTVEALENSAEHNLGEYFAQFPEVQEVHFVTGEDGYFIKLRVADNEELHRFLQNKVLSHSAVLKTRTVHALHTYKETTQLPLLDSDIR